VKYNFVFVAYVPRLTLVLLACGLGISALADAQAPLRATPPEAILWRDPSPIAARDPFWGFGSAPRVPVGPFRFVEEDTDGTQPKVTVTDRRGESWDVKLGGEVHAEVASNRFLWLLGYLGEEMYVVKNGVIEGASGLQRAGEHIGRDGSFVNGRFRSDDPRRRRTDEEWSFHENPFLGTRELSGLVIVMNLINNWDIRESRNNRVLDVRSPRGTRERWFIVSDLGATFGRMGGPIGRRSKWNVKDYLEEDFIESVQDGYVKLDYEGFGKGDLGRIPIEHARWFAGLASRVRVEQLRRVFEAAGATAEEVDRYSTRLSEKISELQAAAR
jgi:hypothetical protein